MNFNSEGESDKEEVQETIFSSHKVESKGRDDINDDDDVLISDDPFKIYDLLEKQKLQGNNVEDEILNGSLNYPPGFTPIEEGDKKFRTMLINFNEKEEDKESRCSGHFRRVEGPKTGGSILQLLDDVVKVGQTMGYKMDGCVSLAQKAKKDWVKELCIKNKVNFLALQETKMENVDNFCIKNCWGNLSFEFVYSPSVGNSGGILCVWDPRMFRKQNSTVSDYFVAIQGVWIPNAKKCLIISVYAPQEVSEKKMLWSYLNHVIDNWSGETIIMGDFNEVRSKEERYGSIFNDHYASLFNSFISSGGLVEVPLGGCAFTWCHKSGNKMSKLDRFLISEGLMGMCPNISAITLDRYLSDHRPILLREVCHDYGPIPFRVFHYWFEWEGFDELVKDTWSKSTITDNNAISKFMKKLKFLKEQIRLFVRAKKESACMQRLNLKGMLTEIDLLIDEKKVDQVLLNKRLNLDQIDDLERNVTKEEIKRAVWDCGTDNLLILANRLVMVLGDLVSEVQSAFIANRQILDGPFILNELIQWCKSKKKQTMIFKIDFEKAYDSVRWDYLDDVLEKFGFGSKWRGWIHNCLHSSKGSILVNGSPTDEFHFF
ncbi:RNA-directed DNA polymerase, eukaryota [Tanacetum coccineum]